MASEMKDTTGTNQRNRELMNQSRAKILNINNGSEVGKTLSKTQSTEQANGARSGKVEHHWGKVTYIRVDQTC